MKHLSQEKALHTGELTYISKRYIFRLSKYIEMQHLFPQIIKTGH